MVRVAASDFVPFLTPSSEPLRVHIAMCVDHQLLGWLMQGSVISAQALEEAHMWAASHTEHSRLVSVRCPAWGGVRWQWVGDTRAGV
jgi:hypothetical protein